MVGGDPAAFEMALPAFRSYGDPLRHFGPLGSGQRMKALNVVVNRFEKDPNFAKAHAGPDHEERRKPACQRLSRSRDTGNLDRRFSS
jgi:hypothetical protein